MEPMDKIKIGFLSIGQSPRRDLVVPLAALLPAVVPLEAGALDGLAPGEVPAAGPDTRFPLTTRLRSGAVVEVDEAALLPHMTHALDHLEEMGVVATLLLCAGTFSGLRGRRPLLIPFVIARAHLRQMGYRRLLVVCPISGQVEPMTDRWHQAGFACTPYVAPSIDPVAAPDLAADLAAAAVGHDCLLLDYIGHPPTHVAALQAALDRPVIDLWKVAAEALLASGLLD
jgi:protein AroM